MKISSRGRYAVRVLVDIANSDTKMESIAEIAKNQNISTKYLEKIVAILVKSDLLLSIKGSQGGYKLTKNINEYTIAQIFSATGDLPELAPCLYLNVECPNRTKCPSIGCWDKLDKIITDYLNKV